MTVVMARRGLLHHGDTCDDLLKSYCISGLVAFLMIGQFDCIASIALRQRPMRSARVSKMRRPKPYLV